MLGLNGISMAPIGMSAPASAAGAAPGATLLGTGHFVGGAATIQTAPSGMITVPITRTAVFSSTTRVIPFGTESTAPGVGPGPYWKNKQWWIDKFAADQLFYVGDLSRELADSGTTATAVSAIPVGATVLVQPVLQGNLVVLKIGQLDVTPGALNYVTLRVTCADGEQFDRTIHFSVAADPGLTISKDPDDMRFYAFDVSADVQFGGSALASAATPTVAGISSLVAPVIQGSTAIVKLGGLDVSGSPINTCRLPMTFASGEQIFRTIYFTRQDA